MLEAQLATLTWNDMSRRSPLQAAMLKELARLGLSNELSQSLARKIPEDLNFTAARRFALATIARTVQVTGDRWLEEGGRVAFAGPAGAGKTTLIAKLAARWVLRHGPRRIALVSADAVRIGAHEQMHMLGRLLGVTAHTVYDIAELPELLAGLAGQRLVLIDTAGASPRDPELARRLRLLHADAAGPKLETAIVLPASTQAGAIDEVLRRFALAQPTAVLHHQGRRGREPRRHPLGAGAHQTTGRLRQRRPARARRPRARARAHAGRARRRHRASQQRHAGRRNHAAQISGADTWPRT